MRPETIKSDLPATPADLLGRVRRIGWIVTGDEALADEILLPAIRAVLETGQRDDSELVWISAALTALRQANTETAFPRNARAWAGPSAVIGDLSTLNHDQREILALALVEELPPRVIDDLTSRARKDCESLLDDAMMALEMSSAA